MCSVRKNDISRLSGLIIIGGFGCMSGINLRERERFGS